jgi:hypothetical protein
MKKFLFLTLWTFFFALANAQEFAADKLIELLSVPSLPKLESILSTKHYFNASIDFSGDTTFRTYEYRAGFRTGKKDASEYTDRKIVRASLKETFTLTYKTGSLTEYTGIITALKKMGFHCEYDKDSAGIAIAYLYQHEDYTANAYKTVVETTPVYAVTFYKKKLPVDKDLHFAEDLLEFTSHEYLVYYFGEKNVKKDIYYFAGNDIVKCSVLFINTKRQVIFIWKDGLNRCKIDNLLFGGQHKLKSQRENDNFIAENSWLLKSGVHANMPLFELRTLNGQDIVFCGGAAANPGLVFPESSGKVDFKNADIILGCMNCSDEKFQNAKTMEADKALQDGRVLFVLTIALYPLVTGIFN